MKKTIIASLVGGIIIFFVQFLFWAALNLHAKEQLYTPNQDAILKSLEENLPEEGQYFIPNLPPNSSSEEYEAHMAEVTGKPWAQVFYHKANNTSMPMNMARGLLVDIVAAWLLVWVLMKMGNASMQTMLFSSLAIGLMGYITGIYATSIWFETHAIASLLESIASWGLCGIWMGWYLRR